MKALLVQSPATSPWVPRRQWEPPSLAMATIAGQIDNHDVRVADMVVWRNQAVPRFLGLLRTFKPDVVGFSSMTFQYDTTAGFAYLTKQFDSRIRTVLGGYHATLFSESIATGQDVGLWDFLMRGEGDFAFGEMLDSIEAGGTGMDKVLGLSYKQDGVFRHNTARPLEDLARIRIPARDKRVAKGFHMYFRQADVIETSRGCLNLCNFCSIREMYGRSFRLFPLERVLADIEDAYSRGARHIFCTDDNITLDMDRFEQLCDGVIRLKLKNLMFTTQASPIGFAHRPDIAKKMVEAGFVSIFLGIENASTKNLKAMHNPNTLDTIQQRAARGRRREPARELPVHQEDGHHQHYGSDHDPVSQNADSGRDDCRRTRRQPFRLSLVRRLLQQCANQPACSRGIELRALEDAARSDRNVARHSRRLEVFQRLYLFVGVRLPPYRLAQRTAARTYLRH